LINIVARQEYQGAGATENEAMEDCLAKIRDLEVTDLFPEKKT